ncbi:MAG: hypothetical protein KDA79_11235 [Planctomycetaceae bacterium]|nr:hypothetical protein [Planctomycetaceae bacterium]
MARVWETMKKMATMIGRQQALLLAAVVALAGCGGSAESGPERFPLSGEVRMGGQLVPQGEVQLIPDSSAGNNGPASLAYIRDGQFETEPGKGIVGGEYIVEVSGQVQLEELDQDGSPVTEELFPRYTTKVRFDTPPEMYRIDVPASGTDG